jgi:threonine dehydratase
LPNVRVVGVQAANCAPMKKSVETGEYCALDASMETIADGIAVKIPQSNLSDNSKICR